MKVFSNIFLLIAAIFAICTIIYVTVDVILEKRRKNAHIKSNEEKNEPLVIAPVILPSDPEEDKSKPEEMPEIVEHIDAIEADALISDDLALKTAKYESGAGHGKQGIINIGDIDKVFDAGDVVTLAALKEKKLISQNIGRLKVLSDGILNKPITVRSESFSVQAIKMIELTGGTVIILKED